ncbi:MAG: hypothetical protein WBM03_04610 [Steroidobacteraceae bacterium]
MPAGTKLAPKPPAIKDWDTLSADETADVGIDLGTPVVEAIGSEARSKFNGHIPKVTVEVRPAPAKTAALQQTEGAATGRRGDQGARPQARNRCAQTHKV